MKNILNFKSHFLITTPNLNEADDYWSSSGKYYEEYKKLYDEYVPSRGPSKYVNGELIRSISRLLHEYYNNGNGNAKEVMYGEECYDVDRWDNEAEEYYTEEECEEVEEDCMVSRFYDSFLTFIERHGPDGIEDETQEIREIICKDDVTFNEEETSKYTELADKVIKYVIDNYNFRLKVEEVDENHYNYHKKT